jgi:hypothetical protein
MAPMLNQEDIDNQQQLLATHRRTLAHLLQQAAKYGGVSYVPPIVIHGIDEARGEIKQVKEILRSSGVDFADALDDEPREATVLDTQASTPPSPSALPARRLRIFLCHASNDKPKVYRLYHRLRADGFDPWLDAEDLLPGQDWQQEIPKTVRTVDVVMICLSRASITKAGYVQKEIKYALDVADEQPDGAIFLIPLKLEECDVPERLRRWHWVNLYEERGYERLMQALQARATGLELNVLLLKVTRPVVDKSKIRLYAGKIGRELHSNASCLEPPVAQMLFLSDASYCSLVKSGKITYLPFSIFKSIIQIYNKTHYMNSYISKAWKKDPQLDYNDVERCRTTLLSMIEQSIMALEVDLEGILDTLNYDEEEDEGNYFIYSLRFELEANKEWLGDTLQTCNYLRVECWEQLRESEYVPRLPGTLYTKTDETYHLVYILNEKHIKVLREQPSDFDIDTANEVKRALVKKIDQLIDLYDRGFPKISANFKR